VEERIGFWSGSNRGSKLQEWNGKGRASNVDWKVRRSSTSTFMALTILTDQSKSFHVHNNQT